MMRMRVQSWFVLALVTGVFYFTGCDSLVGVAKEPGPAAQGPDTPASGVQPAARPAPPAVSAELADARHLVRMLDLSKLPAPEGAKIGEQSPTCVHIGVPLPVPAAVNFYLGRLDTLGWKPAGPKTSETITDSFAQVSLGKDGFLLTLTAMPSQAKETSVTITHAGNLDTRTLPRIEGAEDQYSSQSSSLYFTSATVDVATTELRRRLQADGWQEYDRAFSQKAVRPDASDLLFRKKAYSLTVSISKPATQPNKSAVQYFVTTLAREMPAPADAKHVEIEESRWILMCEVPRDLAGTADYYRGAMRDIGFSAPPHETTSSKYLTLSFESEGHDLVLVSLNAAEEHSTKVKVEGYSAAFRAAMKKAEEADRLKREAQEKAAEAAKVERAKAFNEASKQQDDMINAAIGNALEDATRPAKQTDLSKKIQADVKAKLDEALKGTDAGNSSKPDDTSEK